MTSSGAADSAGQPWAGRSFETHPSPFADDDGSADPRLAEALRRFRAREVTEADVVDAVRPARLLIPLVAELGGDGTTTGAHGLAADKSQELSIVTVAGPDGRRVLPAFTSVQAMSAWNPKARPVPADGVRVALAAASEETEIVVLDPTSDTEFVLRRPAVWAIAQQKPWLPAHYDAEVLGVVVESAAPESSVRAVQIVPGDPDARFAGAEVLVLLQLEPGLEKAAINALVERMSRRWAASELFAARVDSVAVKLLPAG
ncbi:SseB family protein [Herbiconiux sp. SYSU D00978]|uniref:SseB family protein n=1 Tax=Herbiconiux sp. SYSU D00978 TaxID=2812562 RepID=UPI001A956C75|nr:SseB family protein [Herbiconiux sp. SYSU D00978]